MLQNMTSVLTAVHTWNKCTTIFYRLIFGLEFKVFVNSLILMKVLPVLKLNK